MSGSTAGLVLVWAAIWAVLALALAAGEAACREVSRTAAAEAAATGRRRAVAVLALVTQEERTIGALAFGRIFAEFVAVGCLTLVLTGVLGPSWTAVAVLHAIALVLAVIAVRTGVRSVGRAHPMRVLRAGTGLYTGVVRVCGPLVAARPDLGEDEDLQDVVEMVNESDAIEEEDRELIRSVAELGETIAREVMVPRTDMITVARRTPLRKALALFLRSGYSRIPVTGSSPDDLVGVVYLKDVVRRLNADPAAVDLPVVEVARPAIFVPESKPVDDLLRQMQATHSHIAMVVDEYGGIAGLVTIEDALEEIVGELTDEHDRPEPEIEDLGDGSFRVPARLPVDELGELFGLDIDDDVVDTAGGLLAKALGKVPLPGSAGEALGLWLVADRVEGRRKQLATLIVTPVDPGEAETTTNGRPEPRPNGRPEPRPNGRPEPRPARTDFDPKGRP